MNFVDQHKYQDNERAIYKYTKIWGPKRIVELGYGSGALTVAMAYAIEDDGIINSYDLCSSGLAISRLAERNLLNKCNFTTGNVYNTFLSNPFSFDLILIDVDNTWPIIFDITINNKFINHQIQNGSRVIIEGGADAHPRINKNTLVNFHHSIGKEIFSFTHISGPRTSLSILNLL